MSAPRTIGLLGGSFNPPHVGHVLMATWALCQEGVDEVWFVPTYLHPFGKALADFDVRCEMLGEAIEHLGPRARVEPIESELGGVSYTVRTVEALGAREPGTHWRWIGGADTWNGRESWREWERLETMIEPMIVGREGTPSPADHADAPILPDISSSDIRVRIHDGQDIRGLVAEEVAALIRDRGLYR
jgi:nicotinate-nucleotide adenylyltransferase